MTSALLVVLAFGGNTSKPGPVVLERPTFICLGVRWFIHGDDNADAVVHFHFRRKGEDEWKQGLPLFRVQKGVSRQDVPEGAWLFAGSIFDLKEDTAYELRLTLADPDGGGTEKILEARTRSEPLAPEGMRIRHVVPGEGGGNGTEEDPFRGLTAAGSAAQPGDLFLVHKGVYPATFAAAKSGTPQLPIVWRAAGDGEAVIDGARDGKRAHRGISAGDVHDIFFEGLTIRNVEYGIVMHRSSRMVVRRCHIHGVDYGLTWTNNDPVTEDITVADCVIEGPSAWPRTKGIEGARGIQVSGRGHVCCYNRIRGFADGIDTFPSTECSAIDFYGNEISEMTDDGIEMDYSQHNTRCFRNRLTNIFQGISTQPVYGGPVYIFRNAMLNVEMEVFKMHNDPSGALVFHNTSLKAGVPNVLYTSRVRNFIQRNNLFIGAGGRYAYESTARMVDCDFDYDGWGGKWGNFCKWNGKIYATLEEVRRAGVFEKHGFLVDPTTAFASGLLAPKNARAQQFPVSVNDLRPGPGADVIDRGVVLPNINDGFRGEAPDAGCYELGGPLPHYGPRPPEGLPKPVRRSVQPDAGAGTDPANGASPEERAGAAQEARELLRASLIVAVNAGTDLRIQVDYMGTVVRAVPVRADEEGLELEAAGEIIRVRWEDLSPRRFLAAAKTVLGEDPAAQEAVEAVETHLEGRE